MLVRGFIGRCEDQSCELLESKGVPGQMLFEEADYTGATEDGGGHGQACDEGVRTGAHGETPSTVNTIRCFEGRVLLLMTWS